MLNKERTLGSQLPRAIITFDEGGRTNTRFTATVTNCNVCQGRNNGHDLIDNLDTLSTLTPCSQACATCT